jgi:hypothetical protein
MPGKKVLTNTQREVDTKAVTDALTMTDRQTVQNRETAGTMYRYWVAQ